MLVRKSQLSDFSGIYKLISQAHPENKYDYEELNFVFLKCLKASTQFYLTLTEEQKIIGYCSLTIKNSLLCSGYLAAIEEFLMNKETPLNAGGLLLETSIKLAEENNCKSILIHQTTPTAKNGDRLFRSMGFVKSGELYERSIVTPEAI